MEIEGILALLIPFAAMAMAFGIVYLNRTQKTKEKLAMLEKGFSPEEIKSVYEAKSKSEANSGSGSNPYLWIGAGVGLLVGHALTLLIPINNTLAYMTCAFLFAGVALLIQRKYDNKKLNN
ncbi:hypothetical protein GCM10009118_28510 [Wandonia haliotis]|uniref:DUF6249 domain-containing protein n=1 Tax=Wandonia haliotis TaxID=574963 RepID=A0ABN1MU06_9FLAO